MDTSAQPLLSLEGLTKVFYTDDVETHALSGIHLSLRRGDYVSIAGPSGCGKSTLLSILLADEPTGNLDSKNGEAVMQLMHGLHQEGATICMITHDPRFAACADRTIQLFDGRVVEESATPGVTEDSGVRNHAVAPNGSQPAARCSY